MLTFKCLIGLICFLYPTRVEGAGPNVKGSNASKVMAHADQTTCGTVQGLTHKHAA